MDITWVSQLQVGFCNAVLASIWDVSASLRCTIIVCGTHFTQGQSPSSCYLCCAVFCFLFFCVCACMCAYACMYKRNPSVEHHPIAKFLEAAKVKSANFSDIIHLYSVCLRIEAAVFSFLPPIIPRQWLTSLAWHLCTEAHTVQQWTEKKKDIFEPIAGQPWCSPLCSTLAAPTASSLAVQ